MLKPRKKMKKSCNIFHIRFLSFYDRAYPVHELVADVVHDKHLVLSLLDLSQEVFPDVGIMVDGGQRAHMEVFLEGPVGHWVYPGLSEYGGAGSVFEGHHATVTGKLSGVVVTGEEVCKDGQVERRDLPDPGNGGGEPDGLVELVIGEHEFLDLGLDTFDLGVEGLVDAPEICLGELPQGGAEELQFVGVLVHVGACVDEFPSDLEQDLDLFEDFGNGPVEFHFPMVLGGVDGDSLGIDPVVLPALYADAPEDLDGHLDTEVGLFPDQLCDDEPAIDPCMLEAHKRVVQADLLVSEESDKGVGPFFGVFEHIRGSPVIFDDGHVEEPFRYVDTDKAREVFSFHDIGF